MAAAVRLSTLITECPNCNPTKKCLGFSAQFTAKVFSPAVASRRSRVTWSSSNGPSSSEISWLDEQKKLANVSPESPVYFSVRMDGRVRGYPPWNAFVAQVKGIWSGLLDGMDGRVQ